MKCGMVVDWKAEPDGDGGFEPGEEIYCTKEAVAMCEGTVPVCPTCCEQVRDEDLPITPLPLPSQQEKTS